MQLFGRAPSMLLVISVVAILSAALFLIFLRDRQKPSPSAGPPQLPPAGARPLFQPSESDIRRDERESARAEAEIESSNRRQSQKTLISSAEKAWLSSPDRTTTLDLLRVAAESGDADLFYAAAREVDSAFQRKRIAGLASDELAAMLIGHYNLLPEEGRGGGDSFWLKQEVAGLISEDVEN